MKPNKLRAELLKLKPEISSFQLEIEVMDENDNPPTFYINWYKQEVPVDFPLGFTILTLHAEDKDLNSEIQYHIEEDSSGGLFSVDAKEGFVKFTRSPPLANRTYNIVVSASDGTFTDMANASIRIYVPYSGIDKPGDGSGGKINVAPYFLEPAYSFTVTEGVGNERIGRVQVTDPDGDSSLLDLSVKPDDMRQLFTVDNSTGIIYTRQGLPYRADPYTFLIVALDRGNPPMTAFTQIKVSVRDINDHVPIFSKTEYSGLIPPNAKPPYSMTLGVKAEDDDMGLNAKIAYSLEGPDAECFQIDRVSAQITLTSCELDFYTKNMYKLTVVARDRDGDGNGTSSSITILLSPPVGTTAVPVIPTTQGQTSSTTLAFHRPCKPIFPDEFPSVAVTDSMPSNSPIYQAKALLDNNTNLCSDVRYQLSGPDFLSIDPISGVIRTTQKLSSELLKRYGITTESFGPDPALPAVDYFRVNISVLVGNEGSFMLLELGLLSLETFYASSNVTVFDRPIYTFKVSEEQNPGAVVGKVEFRISAPDWTFEMEGADGIFSIAPSGLISTTRKLDSDGANRKDYALVLKAYSRSLNITGFTAVTVSVEDVNDQAPQFAIKNYEFEIPEGPYGIGGAVIGSVEAVDHDAKENALVQYSINSTNSNELPFHVDRASGRISVFGLIDRELNPVFSFKVIAFDSGVPSQTATVVVTVVVSDVNDNAPVFEYPIYRVSVKEQEDGALVTTIKANDADTDQRGTIAYRLLNYAGIFSINDTTGELRTMTPLSLPTEEVYDLQVLASDMGRPPLSSVVNVTVEVVSASQTLPQFKKEKETVDIPPTIGPNEIFYQVTAGVGPITYAIESNLFQIDPITGRISLSRNPNESEKNRLHVVTITASTNGSVQDSLELEVDFVDNTVGGNNGENSFTQKQFWVQIPENKPGKTFLVDLNSTYEQSNIPCNYSFAKPQNGLFEIEWNTGKLYAIRPLDREERSLHIITIKVSDGERVRRQAQRVKITDILKTGQDEAIVVVNVTDLNDNAPEFQLDSPDGIIFTVAPNAPIGTKLGKLIATDKDLGGNIVFSLKPGADADKFRIDPLGTFTVATDMSRETRDVFSLDVDAFDGLQIGTANIKVFKLSSNKLAVLVAGISASEVRQYIWQLERQLSLLTGWNTTVNVVTPYSKNGKVDQTKSNIFVYAVDPKTKEPIDSSALIEMLNKVFPRIKQQVPPLALESVALPQSDSTDTLSTAEIALIVVSCLIILTALLGTFLIFRWWRQRDKEKVSSEYMVDSHSSGPRPYDTRTLDRKTASSILIAPRDPYSTQPRSIVSALDNRFSAVPYDPEIDFVGSSGGSSVASTPYLYFDNFYYKQQPPRH